MSTKARDNFLVAAFHLSKAAPAPWYEFEIMFRAYVSDVTEMAVRGHPESALVAHGHAQGLLALRDEFANLQATFDKLKQAQERAQEKQAQVKR